MTARRRPLTVSSDLGPLYGAQVNAVLARALGPTRFFEVTHLLPAHAVEEAGFLLDHFWQGFPAGTVHLAVVDPGVGGSRVPLAVRLTDGTILVGPENGLLDRFASRRGVARAVRLERDRLGLAARVGATFDGRDLFGPAAAALALGRPLRAVGRPYAYRPAPSRGPAALPDGGRGRVVHIDHFGNAITDLPSEWFPPPGTWLSVRTGRGGVRRARLAASYAALVPGSVGVLPSSFGTLELAVPSGRAAERLGLQVGDPVTARRAGGAGVRRGRPN